MFPSNFYCNYWIIVQSQIVHFVQECFRTKHIFKGINSTWIVLIPKIKNIVEFNQFRLISLYNFTHKVVSKITIQRLRKLVGKIISSNQSAIIEGCWIAKNLMKIDIIKAYDRMELAYIDYIIGVWGFLNDFHNLISNYLNFVSYCIFINESLCGLVKPLRGLR